MLGGLPEKPPPAKKDKNALYYDDLNHGKAAIINNNYHRIEYNLIKIASGADYHYLKYEVEIQKLWKIVVIKLMELI